MNNTTQLKFHQNISINHGSDILKDVRNCEKLARKVARFRNHLRFSLHCKHNGAIPVSLRLNSSCGSHQARRVLKRAERALLNTRWVTDIYRQLGFMDQGRKEIATRLHQHLPDEIFWK